MKNFLTPTERDNLRLQHKKERIRINADRIKAILLSDDGWTYRDIAKALLLDEQSISRHVDEYKTSTKLTSKSGGGYVGKLTCQQSLELNIYLENTVVPYLKISDICAYVQDNYKVSYTIAGMTAWMHTHNFSYKKPAARPAKADELKQQAFIKIYNDLMNSTLEDEPILFGDGVHPTMATKITYGWIKTGMRKTIATTASRTRVNLMGALNLHDMTVIVEEYETIDSIAMEQHFNCIKAVYPLALKIHYILDQGPYNTSAATKKAASERNIILHYLPPYSPNLNPIERLWKVMNEHVRNNVVFTSAKEFRGEIHRFFKLTWPKISMSMVDRINDNFQRLDPLKT